LQKKTATANEPILVMDKVLLTHERSKFLSIVPYLNSFAFTKILSLYTEDKQKKTLSKLSCFKKCALLLLKNEYILKVSRRHHNNSILFLKPSNFF